MVSKEETVKKVKDIVKQYFDERTDNTGTVPLMSRLYDENEVSEVVDTLLTPERLTLNASGKLKIETFTKTLVFFVFSIIISRTWSPSDFELSPKYHIGPTWYHIGPYRTT